MISESNLKTAVQDENCRFEGHLESKLDTPSHGT